LKPATRVMAPKVFSPSTSHASAVFAHRFQYSSMSCEFLAIFFLEVLRMLLDTTDSRDRPLPMVPSTMQFTSPLPTEFSVDSLRASSLDALRSHDDMVASGFSG